MLSKAQAEKKIRQLFGPRSAFAEQVLNDPTCELCKMVRELERHARRQAAKTPKPRTANQARRRQAG